MSTVAIDQYRPLVDRFVDAIRVDFRIAEAIAQRGSTLHANREGVSQAGSRLSGE